MARNWISTTTSRFLSTLSLRRATALDRLKSQATVISIHALLAESDRRPDRLWRAYHGNFYPRSPCGERRPDNFVRGGHFRFLSTLSLRRATGIVPIRYGFGATFLSTLSLRRATRLCQRQPRAQAISIHALLAESDFFAIFKPQILTYFYPRSPCGERLDLTFHKTRCINFYPRSPCGERHEALEHPIASPRHFYPRSPCGERLPYQRQIDQKSNFYPRSPCGERPCPSPC